MEGIDTKKKLRELINGDKVVLGPCAYDAISARCIERAGFELVGTTGFGIHGAKLAVPDNGMLAFNEMLETCSNIVDAVNVPVMADAEGGYGNATNTWRTIQSFEKAGLAGLFIEDQKLPPNCPFFKGTSMISIEEMCGKIRAACDARKDPNFVIVARTEARNEEAVERAIAYAEAGADMIKVIPHTRQELEYYPTKIKTPLHLGFSPGKGINDGLTAWDAGEMGYKIVTFPMTALFANVRAMMNVLTELRKRGTDDDLLAQLMPFEEYFDLVNGDFYRAMDAKYLNP